MRVWRGEGGKEGSRDEVRVRARAGGGGTPAERVWPTGAQWAVGGWWSGPPYAVAARDVSSLTELALSQVRRSFWGSKDKGQLKNQCSSAN